MAIPAPTRQHEADVAWPLFIPRHAAYVEAALARAPHVLVPPSATLTRQARLARRLGAVVIRDLHEGPSAARAQHPSPDGR